MAYIGQSPFQDFTSTPSKDSFTGDGSTTTFDLAQEVAAAGENALEVFVNNVRQEPGTGKAFTLGNDASGDNKRITFTAAPASSAAIYVINDKTNLTTIAPIQTDFNGVELILDADADTTLTADTDDRIDFKIAGADHISIGTSSGDTLFKTMTDAKDILFQQYDGRTILDINDGGYVAIANGATGPGQLRLYEDTDLGTNYTALQVGTQSADITYTLPTADGTDGYQLTTDGSGALSWAAAGTTISNNTNNRVVTGTGSALNGEANLTFDGSTLAVTGATTISTTLAVTGIATFTGVPVLPANTIDSAHYVDGSIDLAHMSVNSIDSDQYVDGSIDTAHIAADQIVASLIADNAIDSEHYTDGSIDTAHIANDQITAALIADNAIDSDMYVDGSIDLAHMSVNSIDSDQYVDGSIDLVHLSANSVDSDQYVDGSIDTAHIANDQITAALIADNAIDSDMYVDGSIDNAHLADDAVDSDEIAAGAIDLAHMSVNSIDSDQYVDGSIDTAHIANDQITAALMADNSIDSDMYVDGSIDNAHIADDAIDSEHYAAGSIDAAHIANDTITATQIAANAIGQSELGGDAVTGGHIADDAIDSEHYADGSIDRAHLAADIIDGTKIADDVINSEHYVAASIDNEHLADDAVGVAELSASGTANSGTFLRGDNAWAAAGGGKLGQVVSFVDNSDNTISTSSNSFTTMSAQVTITPEASSSKILVIFNAGKAKQYPCVRLHRDGSQISKGGQGPATQNYHDMTQIFYDSPGGTSAYNYRMYWRQCAGSNSVSYVKVSGGNNSGSTMNMVAIEILA